MHECIKEHDGDIRLIRTQTSAVSEHANETRHYPLWDKVKFVDRNPHWYTRRDKEGIHIRLHPNNINGDNGIEILEVWMPMIKQHDCYHSGCLREQRLIRTMRIEMHQSQTTNTHPVDTIA